MKTPEQIAAGEGFGKKVDFHCPFDETTLRVDLSRTGFHICPCCHESFEAPEEIEPLPRPPRVFSDQWLKKFINGLFATKPEPKP